MAKKEYKLEELINACGTNIDAIYCLKATKKELEKYPNKPKIEWVATTIDQAFRGATQREALELLFNYLKKRKII